MTFKSSQVCSLSVSYSPMTVSQARGETKGSAHVQHNRVNTLLAFEGRSYIYIFKYGSFENHFFLIGLCKQQNSKCFPKYKLNYGVCMDHFHDHFANMFTMTTFIYSNPESNDCLVSVSSLKTANVNVSVAKEVKSEGCWGQTLVHPLGPKSLTLSLPHLHINTHHYYYYNHHHHYYCCCYYQ